jgi:DNA polymerase (family X)
MTNERIAMIFEEIADVLEQQAASPHRVRAWRGAAQGVREHPRELGDVLRDHGRAGLEAVPHVGPRVASVVIELIRTGRSALLDRLRGDVIETIACVPGLGRALAERIHRALGVETLEELELAAHDGRLERVPGFGPRRAAAVRDILASRLSDAARARARHAAEGDAQVQEPRRPPVHLLLEVDHLYRAADAANALPRIAPRRFNAAHEAWLPILHTDRDGWAFTVLYSNTALAHQLGRTREWVVILHHEADGPEERTTVVTERRGPLRGRRVVRGRELECQAHYAALEEAGAPASLPSA